MGVVKEGGRSICLSDQVSGEQRDGSGDEGVGVFVCQIKCLGNKQIGVVMRMLACWSVR